MTALPRRTRAGYALAGVSTGTYGTVPGLLLMPYLTDELGVQAAVAGLVVLAPKALDVVLNPVAGRISDRSPRADRRRPFVVRAGIVMALAFAALFAAPVAGPVAATAWALGCSLVAAAAYAFFFVPFLAMAAEITDDYDERTRLMTGRVVVITLAILLAGGSAPLLVDAVGGVAGYRTMGLVMAVVIAAGTAAFAWGTRGAPLRRTPATGGSLRAQLAAALASPHARTLLLAFVLQAAAMGTVLAGIVYAARTLVGDPAFATWAFVAFVGPAVVVAPLWQRVALRVGKKDAFTLATVVLAVGLGTLLFAHDGGTVALLVGAGIVGVGYAGGQLLPLAMLPDLAAHDAATSGEDQAGALSGVWSGCELLGYALGPALFGLVLTVGGYTSASGGGAEQTDAARLAVALGISLVPAALVVLSLLPLRRYRLDAALRDGGVTTPA